MSSAESMGPWSSASTALTQNHFVPFHNAAGLYKKPANRNKRRPAQLICAPITEARCRTLGHCVCNDYDQEQRQEHYGILDFFSKLADSTFHQAACPEIVRNLGGCSIYFLFLKYLMNK
jgi:hypothetical protein